MPNGGQRTVLAFGGRHKLAIAATCALFAVAGELGAAQGPPQTGTAALSGVVVDAMTGQPVAGAVVSFRTISTGGPTLPRMVTDRQGRFLYVNLPPADDYFLDARAFGYAHTRYGWTAPGGSLTLRDIARISLAEGQWLSGIKVPLWQLATIEGRVLDERNEPVVGVAVRAFSTRLISSREQLVGGPIVTTDDRGVYRMTDLEPGSYFVGVLSVQHTVLDTAREARALRPVGGLASGGIGGGGGASVSGPTIDAGSRHRLALSNFATPPPPDARQPRAYPAVYYPASPTMSGASRIEIAYGDSRTGLDFTLIPMPTVRVSGRLENPNGAVPEFLLRLMPVGSEQLGFGSEAATTMVEADGQFTFLNVPPGEYTLLAQSTVMDFSSGSAFTRFADAPGFPAGGITVGSMSGAPGLGFLTRAGRPPSVWGRRRLSVGSQDLDDVVVQLQPAVTVRGRVVFEEGSEMPVSENFSFHAQPADGDPSRGQPSGRTDSKDPTHAFAIEGLMGGRYVLSSFTGLGIVSINHGGRDITDTGFDASTGQDIDDVVVTLTSRRTTVAGTVFGAPATAAVIAFPVDPERWTNYGWDPQRLRTARSGSSGAYEIEGLPKGDYLVIAVDVAHISAWADPMFLAAAAPHATRISLDWGDKATLDLAYQDVRVR